MGLGDLLDIFVHLSIFTKFFQKHFDPQILLELLLVLLESQLLLLASGHLLILLSKLIELRISVV